MAQLCRATGTSNSPIKPPKCSEAKSRSKAPSPFPPEVATVALRPCSLRHHNLDRLFAFVRRVFFCVNGPRPRSLQRDWRVIGDGFVSFMEFHADDLADSLLLHRHAIQNIRHSDRALVVRDDNELRM